MRILRQIRRRLESAEPLECHPRADGINRSFYLAGHYQRNIATDDYEITLIDNGFTRIAAGTSAHGPSTPIPLSEYEIFG
jgi:hypothetical protein